MWSLVNHPRWNTENSGAEGDCNCGGISQEVSVEMNINKLPRSHSCDILEENVDGFCLYQKSLPEAKLKNYGLIALAEKSLQPTIDYVA